MASICIVWKKCCSLETGKVLEMLFDCFSKRCSFFVAFHTLTLRASNIEHCTCRAVSLFNLILLLFRLVFRQFTLLMFKQQPKQQQQRKKGMLLFSHQLNSFILSRRSTCDPYKNVQCTQHCSIANEFWRAHFVTLRTFVRKNDVDFETF